MRYLRTLIALTFFAQLAPVTAQELPGPRSPTDALTSFTLKDGFEIELVAAEPLVIDPIAIAWGADGRLWVVEMGDYPLGVDGKGASGGRVKVLADTDDDGRYDTATLFLDGLHYPTGVLPWGKGALVSGAPDIVYAEDRDGDGRAEFRETWFTGFAEGNQQHRVNGLRWGLDNWIHCANGDSGGTVTCVNTGQKLALGRRDFRFHPFTHAIEPATGQTQYGLDTDDWGHWFGSSNSRPLMQYILDDEQLRRNPHGTIPNLVREVPEVPGAAPVYPLSRTLARFNDLSRANRFTSACGLTIFRGEGLGLDQVGNAFICEPVHNLVHREVMERRGLLFTSRRASDELQSEFLASTDHWFRPVMCRTGPDSALWVVDMYRLVIEHPEWIPKDWQARLDLRAGHDRGRIYRVYHQQHPPHAIARLDLKNDAALVDELEASNSTTRDMARQLLIERRAQQAVPQLRAMAWRSSWAESRVQALSALIALQDDLHATVTIALRDPHPFVRKWGVRLFESQVARDEARFKESRDLVERMLKDPDITVRAQAFASFQQDTLAGVSESDLQDPFLSALVAQSLSPSAAPRLVRELLAHPRRESFIRSSLFQSLIAALIDLRDHETLTQLLQELSEPSQTGAPSQLRAVLNALAGTKLTLPQLRRVAQEPHMQRLATLDQRLRVARQTAVDAQRTLDERRDAVALIGLGGLAEAGDYHTLFELLKPQSPPALKSAAIESLGLLRDGLDVQRLFAAWPSLTPGVRGEVIDLLLSNATLIEAMFKALDANTIQRGDFDAARRTRLIESKDPQIRERAVQLFAITNTPRREVVEQFQDVLRLKGNPVAGAGVFGKRCSQCHRLGEVGHPLGPDLSALSDRSSGTLLAALLDPNRAVEAKFYNYLVTTTAGLTLNGLLEAESASHITLLSGEMKRVALPRVDLDEFVSTNKSLMPEGLEKDLTRQELSDVIAYVTAIRSPPKKFAGNQPQLVRPETLRGEFYLLAQQAEIYGPSLVYESKYANLGYWQSNADHAAWTVAIERGATYEVSLEFACAREAAGNRVELLVDKQRLSAEVPSTGNWDTYQSLPLGRLTLAPGELRVVVRPERTPRGPLLDLKSVRVRPVK